MQINVTVDISEDDVRLLVKGRIHDLVDAQVKSYTTERLIKSEIEKIFDVTVKKVIIDEIANVDALRDKVREQMERKIKAQLCVLMKDA